ncbi:hypothetical protein NLJ89_g7859 [Agrocybe chaxingu]|uniref:Uncharacterized protein n=1 Tax=Agrocybe chaxingu TaxID=84603 RepID=A0A9W8JW01_9AGAR|nr:hypothetical protein NLJ89_g7859 [Agrocybe chaxingu]
MSTTSAPTATPSFAPGGFVPGPDGLVEFQMLGATLGCIAYGVVVMLFIDCVRLMIEKYSHSKCRQRAFLGYIGVMFIISSFFLISSMTTLRKTLFQSGYVENRGPYGFPLIFIPLSLWGADAFRVWRCVCLYKGIRLPRQIALTILLIFLAVTLFGSGLAVMIVMYTNPHFLSSTFQLAQLPAAVLALTSATLNISLGALIALRLIWHRRRTQRALGASYGSPYTKFVSICVESCLLIVVVNFAFAGLIFSNPMASWVPEQLIVHISVISPFLVLRRVAQGIDAITTLHRPQGESTNCNVSYEVKSFDRKPTSIMKFTEEVTDVDLSSSPKEEKFPDAK